MHRRFREIVKIVIWETPKSMHSREITRREILVSQRMLSLVSRENFSENPVLHPNNNIMKRIQYIFDKSVIKKPHCLQKFHCMLLKWYDRNFPTEIIGV